MKKTSIRTLLLACAFGGLVQLGRAADAPAKPAAAGGLRLVDGVPVEDFKAIQQVLLQAAAGDKDIAIIDAQLNALRAQRMELTFKAAAREHPELADKLKLMLDHQHERQQQEQTMARAAARQLKKQGS